MKAGGDMCDGTLRELRRRPRRLPDPLGSTLMVLVEVNER